MLAKTNRLSKDKQIQQAFRTKHRAQTQNARILLSQNQETKFQLLIVISKKVFKKANKRNRLRRKISAIFEDLLAKNRLPPYITCIVQVLKKDLLTKNHNEIYEELIPQISKLHSKIITETQTKKVNQTQPS